jgi:hypothetical protein
MLDSMWGVVRMLLSLTLLMRCWLLTLFVFKCECCFMFYVLLIVYGGETSYGRTDTCTTDRRSLKTTDC